MNQITIMMMKVHHNNPAQMILVNMDSLFLPIIKNNLTINKDMLNNKIILNHFINKCSRCNNYTINKCRINKYKGIFRITNIQIKCNSKIMASYNMVINSMVINSMALTIILMINLKILIIYIAQTLKSNKHMI